MYRILSRVPRLTNQYSSIRKMSGTSFKTEILPVKLDSIVFPKEASTPIINDEMTRKNLEIAAKELQSTNNVVGFPTETVYGLGGSALKDESVKSIYAAKNRPADNPLIIHVSSLDQLKRKLLGPNQRVPEIYEKLISTYWPGPLTLLLPVENEAISKYVTAGQSTFAVRMPSHPVARALIAISDIPLAAPSANASTRPSPTLASHVYHDLQGKIPYILDGGSCDVGVESTVVDGLVSPPMLLRPGGVSLEEIQTCDPQNWGRVKVGKKTAGDSEQVKTPGMKYKHYSPSANVVLFNGCGNGLDAIKHYLQEHQPSGPIALLRLKYFADPSQDPDLAQITVTKNLGTKGADISRNLFAMLREVDELGVSLILVEGIEETQEGLAVMNRLSKAAFVTISN